MLNPQLILFHFQQWRYSPDAAEPGGNERDGPRQGPRRRPRPCYDHDAGDGHDAGDNHDADPFLLWIAWSFGLFEGAFQIAYFLLRYTTSIFFCIFLS